jgi:hypothetical protein
MSCHSERRLGARNLLFLASNKKQIPRVARNDKSSEMLAILQHPKDGSPELQYKFSAAKLAAS